MRLTKIVNNIKLKLPLFGRKPGLQNLIKLKLGAKENYSFILFLFLSRIRNFSFLTAADADAFGANH
jgi:hypothetical protein